MYQAAERRRRARPSARRRASAVAVAAALLPAALGAEGPRTSLEIRGMTFVGSHDGAREVLLRSRLASLRPEHGTAELRDVSATVQEGGRGQTFSMTCDRVELDVESNDFLADGDVKGTTDGGQSYTAEWVRYQHAKGLLFTDAPVKMHDARGSFRGDGFRYLINERRFELLGNVRVEQHP